MAESHGVRTLLPLPFLNFLLIFHHSQLRFRSSCTSSHPTSPSSRNTNVACVRDIGCHQGSKRRQLGSLYSRCTFPWQVIHMLTQQPLFQGLGTSSKLTPLQLESLLTEGTTTRLWLVEFRASYSPACIRSSQHFPELSITYSSKNLSFGIVDLGLFPNAAEKFGISLSGSMGQLPTYILFENAAEVARFPELDFEATYFHPTITKGLLSRHFELDRHLLEYFNGK